MAACYGALHAEYEKICFIPHDVARLAVELF